MTFLRRSALNRGLRVNKSILSIAEVEYVVLRVGRSDIRNFTYSFTDKSLPILLSRTQEKLQKAVAEIQGALAELGLKALKALSFEAEKGKIEKK